MKVRGKSDWSRVRREAAQNARISHRPSDSPYDPNDAKAVADYWKAATLKRGPGRPRGAVTRVMMSLRVDRDVLAALRASGRGWQTRVNKLLRDAVLKHKL